MIERHPELGERILAPIEQLAEVRPIVRACHERYDGTGYPDRLAGDEIPLEARIIFACDAFHAMTTDRPYREALPVERGAAAPRRGRRHAVRPATSSRCCLRVLEAPAARRVERAALSRRGAARVSARASTAHRRARGERSCPFGSSSGSAVESSCAQRRPNRAGGRTNVTGSRQALKRTMNESSVDRLALRRQGRDLGAVQERAEREGVPARPVGLRHLPPVGPEPPDVRRARALPLLAGEERGAAEDRVLGAEPQQPPGELEERRLALADLPVEPRELVVLAVGVVVAALRVAGARRRRAASACPARAAASRGSCGSGGRAAR